MCNCSVYILLDLLLLLLPLDMGSGKSRGASPFPPVSHMLIINEEEGENHADGNQVMVVVKVIKLWSTLE